VHQQFGLLADGTGCHALHPACTGLQDDERDMALDARGDDKSFDTDCFPCLCCDFFKCKHFFLLGWLLKFRLGIPEMKKPGIFRAFDLGVRFFQSDKANRSQPGVELVSLLLRNAASCMALLARTNIITTRGA
jgi:hypothetical protein